MADTLIQADIPVDPSKLFRIGNKIVHPLTISENDDGNYIVFKIDFDGDEELFTEVDHKLDIAITKAQDVTIPLLVNFPTDIPQDIGQLSFAIFGAFQYYQFGINVKAKSMLYVEVPNSTATNVELSIANNAPAITQPVWKTNAASQTGTAAGWYFENNTFAVVQLKVPVGLTGSLMIGQQLINKPTMGVTLDTKGTVISAPTDPVIYMVTSGNTTALKFGLPTSTNKPIIQLYDELIKGKAIAAKSVQGLFLVQGISDIRDWTINGSTFSYLNGKTGAWLYTDLSSSKVYSSNVNTTTQAITYPVANMSLSDKYAIYEPVTGGIRIHYYTLDANLVPIAYNGNSFIPWAYDETKPISLITVNKVAAIGTAYDVNANDLGPLRTDFTLTHNYDIVVTDVTEV